MDMLPADHFIIISAILMLADETVSFSCNVLSLFNVSIEWVSLCFGISNSLLPSHSEGMSGQWKYCLILGRFISELSAFPLSESLNVHL